MPVNLPNNTEFNPRPLGVVDDNQLQQSHHIFVAETNDVVAYFRGTAAFESNEVTMFGPFDTLASALYGVMF